MLKLLLWLIKEKQSMDGRHKQYMKEKQSVDGRHKQYMNTKDEYYIAFTNGQLNAYEAVIDRIDILTREVRG